MCVCILIASHGGYLWNKVYCFTPTRNCSFLVFVAVNLVMSPFKISMHVVMSSTQVITWNRPSFKIRFVHGVWSISKQRSHSCQFAPRVHCLIGLDHLNRPVDFPLVLVDPSSLWAMTTTRQRKRIHVVVGDWTCHRRRHIRACQRKYPNLVESGPLARILVHIIDT